MINKRGDWKIYWMLSTLYFPSSSYSLGRKRPRYLRSGTRPFRTFVPFLVASVFPFHGPFTETAIAFWQIQCVNPQSGQLAACNVMQNKTSTICLQGTKSLKSNSRRPPKNSNQLKTSELHHYYNQCCQKLWNK